MILKRLINGNKDRFIPPDHNTDYQIDLFKNQLPLDRVL